MSKHIKQKRKDNKQDKNNANENKQETTTEDIKINKTSFGREEEETKKKTSK